VYRGLTDDKSVHLTDWPTASGLPQDLDLVRDMDRVREVCSTALALREEKRLRVRLPLAELAVAAEWATTLNGYKSLIENEVNVQTVHLSSRPEVFATTRYSVNAKKAGPRLGATLKAVLAAVKAPVVDFVISGKEAQVKTSEGWIQLLEGEWEVGLVAAGEGSLAVAALTDRKSVVALETRVTPKLEREGRARDLVRVIQQTRKDAKLHISDRIRLRVSGDAALAEAVREHGPYIREQTLALELELGAPVPGWFTAEGEVGEGKATVALVKA
jgi:isoleucyl-tRNA synthetase